MGHKRFKVFVVAGQTCVSDAKQGTLEHLLGLTRRYAHPAIGDEQCTPDLVGCHVIGHAADIGAAGATRQAGAQLRQIDIGHTRGEQMHLRMNQLRQSKTAP